MKAVESELGKLLPDLERVYTDMHAHPELSMQETRTAAVAADRIRAAGFDVTAGVGRTGVVGVGVITSAADSLQIRMFGRGAHGSRPQAAIDPVVMAAATVLRLQTIVSRELAASEMAVVTIGSLQAGTKENVIPDEAIIKLNVRTFDEGVRARVLSAITRIANAEADASGAPRRPEITPIDRYSLVTKDPEATRRVLDAFKSHFSADRLRQTDPTSASEGASGRIGELPTNHNSRFAPILHPTLETGVAALIAASRAWLAA
jgi:metal-dependent amidase/aminoacylase/carboxypeptidase family protein